MSTFSYRSCLILLCLLFVAPATQADDKLKVVTSFTILADMGSNVAGDAAEVVSVTTIINRHLKILHKPGGPT